MSGHAPVEHSRKRRAFIIAYEQRINDGLETCRVCGSRDGLTVARIELDKPWAMFNTTILCTDHAKQYREPGSRRQVAAWRHDVLSIEDEEQARPVEQQWGHSAIEDARRYEAKRAAKGHPNPGGTT